MADVLEKMRWPLGGGPVASGGATRWRDGRGVVRSTGVALGASGVEGADRSSLSISMSSSPSEEVDDSSSEGGGASALGGGMGRALQSLEKGSWSHPQLGQWRGEVGQ